MKNSILICFLTLSMILTSCTKDENKTDIQNEELSIVGVWLWQSETIDGETVDLDSCESKFTLTFDETNNFIDNQPYNVSQVCTDDVSIGTYNIEGSKITFIYSGNGEDGSIEQEFEIVADILTLKYTNEEGENEIAKFKKIDGDKDETASELTSISGINPTSGPKNTIVTIEGSNFGTDIDNIEVLFNGKMAIINSISNSEIEVIVPSKALSGGIDVVINGKTIKGPTFDYILTEIEVSTIAGSIEGFLDGIGSEAKFYEPTDAAVDAEGNLFVADARNNRIRKITPDGVVTTLTGGVSGRQNGNINDALFNNPRNIAIDASGNLFVIDGSGSTNSIRKITPEGEVSTFAGYPLTGLRLTSPRDIVIDSAGNLFVPDVESSNIGKITPEGVVSIFVGSGRGFADGNGNEAKFTNPTNIAIDTDGNLYIVDLGNYKLRKITPQGDVTTLITDTAIFDEEQNTFTNSTNLAVETDGNILVLSRNNHNIRRISSNGTVTTIVGSTAGSTDGGRDIAQFNYPKGIVIGADGNLFVVDTNNNRIRKLILE